MSLTWGDTHRTASRGVVADQCPLCAELRAFPLTDGYAIEIYWEAPHAPLK